MFCLLYSNAKLQGLVVDARRRNSPALVSFGGVAVSLSCSATIRTALSAHPAPPGWHCSGYVCRSAVRRARNNLIWEAPAIIWPSQSGVCTEPFAPATRNHKKSWTCSLAGKLEAPPSPHLFSALSPMSRPRHILRPRSPWTRLSLHTQDFFAVTTVHLSDDFLNIPATTLN